MITDVYLKDLVNRLKQCAIELRETHGVIADLLEEAARTIARMDDGLDVIEALVAIATDY